MSSLVLAFAKGLEVDALLLDPMRLGSHSQRDRWTALSASAERETWLDERRITPRASCRLHCRIRRGDDYVRARIVDISEGGLCLYSPVWLEAKTKIEISIDAPGFPSAIVQAEVWHIRRQKLPNSSGKIWVIGAMLEKSDDAYQKLLAAAGVAPECTPTRPVAPSGPTKPSPPTASPRPPQSKPSSPLPPPSATPIRRPKPSVPKNEVSPEDALEPKIFKIRVQARTGPRTRLLTITAESLEEAKILATEDLQPEWRIVEVLGAR